MFLHELASLPTARREEILGTEHAYQGVFRELVDEAQRAGLVRADVDPRVAGLSILGSTNWVYRWFRADGPSTPEEIAAQLAAMAVHGVATPEAVAARDPVGRVGAGTARPEGLRPLGGRWQGWQVGQRPPRSLGRLCRGGLRRRTSRPAPRRA